MGRGPHLPALQPLGDTADEELGVCVDDQLSSAGSNRLPGWKSGWSNCFLLPPLLLAWLPRCLPESRPRCWFACDEGWMIYFREALLTFPPWPACYSWEDGQDPTRLQPLLWLPLSRCWDTPRLCTPLWSHPGSPGTASQVYFKALPWKSYCERCARVHRIIWLDLELIFLRPPEKH